jgi:hypothetical protein
VPAQRPTLVCEALGLFHGIARENYTRVTPHSSSPGMLKIEKFGKEFSRIMFSHIAKSG